jgi:hypothetical protein
MVLQTIALPLGDRATGPNESWTGEARMSEASPVQFPALDYDCKVMPLSSVGGSKDPPLQRLA